MILLLILAIILTLSATPWGRKLAQKWLLTDLLKGIYITAQEMCRKKMTLRYPEEKNPFSHRFRGLLALRRYPNGEERCIACKMCEAVCPAMAIVIESEERADKTRRTTRFDIDMFKCINCGMCEEACPVDSIVTVPDGEYAIHERGGNIFPKDKLLAIGDFYEPKLAADREKDQDKR